MNQRSLVIILLFIVAGQVVLAQEDLPSTDFSLDSLLNVKVSTASKYNQTVNEAPASVSIITSEDIERYGYRTLEEALANVRSLYLSYDRNYTYVGARGFSRPTDYNDRILLLLNGLTMNDNFYGGSYFGTDFPLDLEAVERIEIVRGPGSALYGTGAMFAVINIITKKSSAIDGGVASIEYGSNRRLHGSVLFGKEFGDELDVTIQGMWGDIKGQDLYFNEYDTDSTNHGIAQNLDWDKYYGFLLTASYDDFAFMGKLSSRKKGIPTASFGTVFNDSRAQTLDVYQYFQLQYNTALASDKHVQLRAYYNHYYYEGTYPYEEISYDANNTRWFGGEAQFRWDISSINRLIVGMEYQKSPRADYRIWDPNGTSYDQNFPYNVFSIYVQDELQLFENLLVTIGARRDAYSNTGSSVTPRFAIVYNPFTATTIKALYGEAFRAPNVYEYNYEDSNAGAKKSPDLKPEKIRTEEIIWEQRITPELYANCSGYYYSMTNLIDPIVDPVDSLDQFKNLSEVKAHGVEVELNYRPFSGAQSFLRYTYQHAQDEASKQKLTNLPNHILACGYSQNFAGIGTASVEMHYETERRTVYNTLVNTSDTTPLLMNVNLTTEQIADRVTASLLIRNLLNRTFKTPGGNEHRQPAITQDGRTFTFRLEVAF